jgi:hypothetical protein
VIERSIGPISGALFGVNTPPGRTAGAVIGESAAPSWPLCPAIILGRRLLPATRGFLGGRLRLLGIEEPFGLSFFRRLFIGGFLGKAECPKTRRLLVTLLFLFLQLLHQGTVAGGKVGGPVLGA